MSKSFEKILNDLISDQNYISYTKEQEKLRKEFVSDYSLQKISKLKIDDYVIGKGKNSFCKRLEFDLEGLGQIRGSPASRYGIWFGVHGDDKTKDYRIANKYSQNNGDLQETFKYIKTVITDLLKAGQTENRQEITDNPLSPLVKYKLLYLYFPENYFCTYSREYLEYFADELGLSYTEKSCEYDLQKALLSWKENTAYTKNISNFIFNGFLYKLFPFEKTASKEEAESRADDFLLNEINKDKNLKVSGKYTDKPKEKTEKVIVDGHAVYPRNRKIALNALKIANYKCENDGTHPTFISKNGTRYMEVHHLIPMKASDEFEYSLDREQNIICLCSNCHNEIHYGNDNNKMIEKLYEKRRALLEKIGIKIDLKHLLALY
mgnify:CR=1 FL=1